MVGGVLEGSSRRCGNNYGRTGGTGSILAGGH